MLKECENGHYYDAERYSCCPYCRKPDSRGEEEAPLAVSESGPDALRHYAALLCFYQDFLKFMESNPGKESMTRYLVQKRLLQRIADLAGAADIKLDDSIVRDIAETDRVLKERFGIQNAKP